MLPPEGESFKKWLKRKFPHTSTARHYANDLDLFFIWASKPLTEVSVQDIDRFIESSQAQGHSIATVNRRLAALRSFYAFLDIELAEPPPNPVIPKRHFMRQGRRLPRDAQDSTLERLFNVVTPPRDRAMFLLMLRCGLRVGEIRNLSLPDLYLETHAGQLPRLRVHGKGGSERIVYLSAQPLTALQTWLQARPASADDALFLNRYGQRYSVTGIQRHLGRYCRRAAVWITCHQFRHTFGRNLAEQRVPVTSIQRLLGHARLRSTETYIHLSDTQLMADYAAAMSEIARRWPLEASEAPLPESKRSTVQGGVA
jgi:site-specific recombinase XerD